MRFFHGTSTTRLTDIVEDGLVPQAAHDNPERYCIYLTNDRTLAEMYADLASIRRGGRPVIVEIDDTALPTAAFEPDDYELQNHIDDLHDPDRKGPMGFLTGEEVDERLRPYRSWKDVSASLCLLATKQVAFTAPIPPASISNLRYLVDDLQPVRAPSPLASCSLP